MSIKGIIAEFDPFHNGHQHIISQMKSDNSTVVAALGGDFLQRGEPSLFTKQLRANAALCCGVDLVLELPLPWSCSPAHNFALGGISLLKAAGCDTVCFGAEDADAEALFEIADFCDDFDFNPKSAAGFAVQRSKIISEKLGEKAAQISAKPNNALGIEYIKAARELNYDINFLPINRVNAEHNSDTTFNSTASASKIRYNILNGIPFSEFVPKNLVNLYSEEIRHKNILKRESFEISLLSYLRRIPDFGFLPDISEGLENKIAKSVKISATYSQLIDNIRSKRYPTSRIKRLVTCAFLDIDDFWYKKPVPYIKVLGFTEVGKAHLKNIAKTVPLPIIVCGKSNKLLDKNAQMLLNKECIRSDLYNALLERPRLCGTEYTDKIIKKGD